MPAIEMTIPENNKPVFVPSWETCVIMIARGFIRIGNNDDTLCAQLISNYFWSKGEYI